MKVIPLFVFAAAASAQVVPSILKNPIGSLPSCASSCSVLQNAVNACGSSSDSTTIWACFCQNVYTGSGSNINSICPSSCSSTEDAAVASWFTQNCGSDNGASEHSGTSSGTGTSGSSAPGSSTSSTASSGSDGNDNFPTNTSGGCSGSWFHCHYQWVIMIIVVAIGLIALGFGGRWLKKRHDRKSDQIRAGFNAGITSRATNHVDDDKAAPASRGENDSPARTRDAFMPYGYGYSRSDSSHVGSSFTRGGSPVNEMEKGAAPERSSGGPRERLMRVLGRERNAS